jgi:uncharacterized protein YkwD
MFAATGLEVPRDRRMVNRVMAVDGGLVALHDRWKDPDSLAPATPYFAFHTGAVPDLPFASGPLSATFTAWLQRANSLRAQAGLPPLLGDPAISAAADNHSRYWTQNPMATGLSVHRETPGKPGFSGVKPSDRCGTAGAEPYCGEVMFDAGRREVIDGWVATLYHRFLIMDPTALLVGGGQVNGGPAVMDGGRGGGLLVGPVMFPFGRYDGDLEFSGEVPDPADECRRTGQQVSMPLGTAVSVWVPGGRVSGLTVAPTGGPPLRGCTLDKTFLPDDALTAGTTYQASAMWTPTDVMGPGPITWQFTTGGNPNPGKGAVKRRPCSPSLTRTSVRVRRGAAITVRVRACARGKVTVAVYRWNAHTPAQRRALATKSVLVRKAGTASVRISSAGLKRGRYRLRASLSGPRLKTLKTTVWVTGKAPGRRS